MRRGRDPSRTPSRPRRPVFDNPRGQLPGTGIRSDADNLYSGNLYGGSAQGVSGNSSGQSHGDDSSSFARSDGSSSLKEVEYRSLQMIGD